MIMPIVLLTIVSVIWLMISLYDRTVMYKALVHAVLEADYQNVKSNNDLKEKVEERIDEELKGQLLGIDEADINVKVSKRKIVASIAATFTIPENIPGLSNIRETYIEIEKTRLSGVELISDVRRIKAIYDIAKGLMKENEETELSEGESGN